MFPLTQTKMKPGFVLLVDIGSSSVDVSLAHCDGVDKSRIVYFVRKDFVSHTTHSFESHIECMRKSLRDALHAIQTETNAIPLRAVVSFASPWHISQTRTAMMQRSTPFVVKKDLIKTLKSKEEKKFLDEHKGMFGKTDSKGILLESKIVDTQIDGYGIVDFIGKKASTLSVSLRLSVAPKEVVEVVEDIIAEHIHIRSVSFTTSQSVVFIGIRDMSVSKEDFLIIDIDGELTDVSLIRNDVLLESVSFPLGTNFFKSRLKKHFNWNESQYQSHMSMKESGKLDDVSVLEFERYLAVLVKDWSLYARRAIHELGGTRLVPEKVYLLGDTFIGQYLKHNLSGGDFQHFTHTQNPLHVTLLSNAHLHELCYIQHARPSPLSILLSYFANRISNTH